MDHTHVQHDPQQSARTDRLRTVSRYVFFGFLAIAAFFLLTEHRAHLYGTWPFLLLALCPLLHFFHHRGHGKHEEESSSVTRRSEPPSSVNPPGRSH